MTDEKAMKQAKSVFDTICQSMDSRGWHYDKHEEDLTITCTVRGEDLPMDVIFVVNPGARVVSLFSPLPFNVAEDKRIEAALAVCVANYGLRNGSFDYDLSDGEIRFRVVSSFLESILSPELFDYMMYITIQTVEEYNDKFLMVSKGMMSFQQFVEWENNKNNE